MSLECGKGDHDYVEVPYTHNLFVKLFFKMIKMEKIKQYCAGCGSSVTYGVDEGDKWRMK